MDESYLQALNNLLKKSEAELDAKHKHKDALSKTTVIGGGVECNGTNYKTQPCKDDPKAIWVDKEIPSEYGLLDDMDPRPTPPDYDIVLHQDVFTEDIFLGANAKTPGSQDCSHIVLKVKFPGAKQEQLSLRVMKEMVICSSNEFLLSTFLPYPVNNEDGTAKWDGKTETLKVVLPIAQDNSIPQLSRQ